MEHSSTLIRATQETDIPMLMDQMVSASLSEPLLLSVEEASDASHPIHSISRINLDFCAVDSQSVPIGRACYTGDCLFYFVTEAYQRKGIATALVKRICDARNRPDLNARVLASNAPSIATLLRAGFQFRAFTYTEYPQVSGRAGIKLLHYWLPQR